MDRALLTLSAGTPGVTDWAHEGVLERHASVSEEPPEVPYLTVRVASRNVGAGVVPDARSSSTPATSTVAVSLLTLPRASCSSTGLAGATGTGAPMLPVAVAVLPPVSLAVNVPAFATPATLRGATTSVGVPDTVSDWVRNCSWVLAVPAEFTNSRSRLAVLLASLSAPVMVTR